MKFLQVSQHAQVPAADLRDVPGLRSWMAVTTSLLFIPSLPRSYLRIVSTKKVCFSALRSAGCPAETPNGRRLLTSWQAYLWNVACNGNVSRSAVQLQVTAGMSYLPANKAKVSAALHSPDLSSQSWTASLKVAWFCGDHQFVFSFPFWLVARLFAVGPAVFWFFAFVWFFLLLPLGRPLFAALGAAEK